jgi:hypothetical protein
MSASTARGRCLQTDVDAVKQSRKINATRARQKNISLGDWNAGKENEKLARPELWCPHGLLERKTN